MGLGLGLVIGLGVGVGLGAGLIIEFASVRYGLIIALTAHTGRSRLRIGLGLEIRGCAAFTGGIQYTGVI